MDLLINDRSVHEQFHSIVEFQSALKRVMGIRDAVKRYGRDIQCHRSFLNSSPLPDITLQQALGNLGSESQRRAVMIWLTRSGPFWDDIRQHGEDDWLEYGEEIVTDSAVGEAAFRVAHGIECGVVSFSPSDWLSSPLGVTWCPNNVGMSNQEAEVNNWWDVESISEALERRALPVGSWNGLRETAVSKFDNLVFARDCFGPLAGVPFAKSAADRFLVLLEVLSNLSRAFDEEGTRTREGHHIYQKYFARRCALFSDSSVTEKKKFCRELTFPHPEDPKRSLCCTWHGKVSHMTLRLHFSWPVEAKEPVYVVYAGPKITKQ